MRPEVSRRMFVGSILAGFPLLAGRSGLLAQSGSLTHAHDALAAAADPVIDQIVRQIALIHNSAQGEPRGAHTRALAAQLRMLVVYQKQMEVDDKVRTALQDIVQREGRQAVLYAEPDLEARGQVMQKYGFRPHDRARDVRLNPTHAAREAALDELLQQGVTPAYERLAGTLERVSERLDRRRRGLVTLAQDDWQQGFCIELWDQYTQAQLMAVPFCLTARYFAWAAPACLAMEGGAATLLVVYLWEC